MPGLFGVVDLHRRDRGPELDRFAAEVVGGLTREPGYCVDWGGRDDWAVIGRIGASIHNNTPWGQAPATPAVAGIPA